MSSVWHICIATWGMSSEFSRSFVFLCEHFEYVICRRQSNLLECYTWNTHDKIRQTQQFPFYWILINITEQLTMNREGERV